VTGIDKDQKKLEAAAVPGAALRAVGEEALRIIHDRTLKGQDVDGRRFKPYSPGYKTKRAETHRSLKPDLTWTGRMLNSMRIIAESIKGKYIVLGWQIRDEAEKADSNQRMGREFFDIRQRSEIARLERVYQVYLK